MYRGGYVYIITNAYKNVLYIGVAAELKKRSWEHRNHIYSNSFTTRYNIEFLVYYEGFDTIEAAILREKQLKKWSRSKKNELINSKNPHWNDLYDEVMHDIYSLL